MTAPREPESALHALVPRMRPYARTIFGETSALARRIGAMNLGQGFPDTDGPEELKRLAIDAIRDGRGNQYPPAHGLPELRRAIAAHQERFYRLTPDPEHEVVVGTGASEIIAATLLALVEPGDEVVVFEPWFDIYAAGIGLAGATRVSVPLRPDPAQPAAGPRPDLAALRAAITPRTRLILLNSPHNPTGIVLTPAELEGVAAVARDHDLLVLSDEAYEHLWFPGHPHHPIAAMPGMWDRTVTVGSGGKTFSFTGWKVGWASGPRDLIAAVRVVRQHLSYVSSGPFQWAVAGGLELPDSYFREFRSDLQAKRDQLAGGLASVGFDVAESQGTYFLTTDVRSMGYADGVAFCHDLPGRAGIVAIPQQLLCDDPTVGAPFVRWAFCKRPEVLAAAVEQLRRAFG